MGLLYKKSLSVDATIIVSNKWPMIGECMCCGYFLDVTHYHSNNIPLILALIAYNSKTILVNPIFFIVAL